MDINEIDNNATGALHMMIKMGAIPIYGIVNLDNLGNMFVMWQTGKNLKELVSDENIPDHNKEEKLRKINLCKKAAIENVFTDTTIFGMRKDINSPIVITDGIHRAIGIKRAIIENPSVKEKVLLRILLFTGINIEKLEDYTKSIGS